MKLIPASDASLLVLFGNAISPELHRQVIALLRALQAQADPHIRNLHPGYASLLIDFDSLRLSHEELGVRVRQMASVLPAETESSRVISIPVCYGLEFGPDLIDVAEHAKLSSDEVVRLHSSATYLVYFLGFSPGFAYMGGLPEAIQATRLATPRGHVAAGSVGIAGSQTGIYPVDSAGGWRLIGRTPLAIFNPDVTPPTLLQPGDRVQFSPIDRATFSAMAQSQ